MSQKGIPMATIIASPIASSSKNDDFTKEWISEERVEQSSTLFSQLDSMIAAVQSESSALDNMRNKVKELDVMKDQVANLNRRLLEADETNFAMKATLVRQQEQIVDSRKSQTETGTIVAPLKAELQRTKDAFAKERQIRNKVTQENAALKEQGMQYERIIQQLQEQCSINARVIPEQKEQLERMGEELGRVRQQARASNDKLVRKVKELQRNIPPALLDNLKSEVQQLANKLLAVTGSNSGHSYNPPPSLSQSQQSFGHAPYGQNYSLETSYNPEDYDNDEFCSGLDDLDLDDMSEVHVGGDVNTSDITGVYDYNLTGVDNGNDNGNNNGNNNGGNSGDTHVRVGKKKRKSSKPGNKMDSLAEVAESEFSLDAPLSLDHEELEGATSAPAPSAPAPTSHTKGGMGSKQVRGQAVGQKKKKDKDKTSLPKI